MKMKKILSAIVLSCFSICIVFLAGCSDTSSNAILNSTINNMTKLSNVLDKVQDIDNNQLVISDFMDEDNLSIIDLSNDEEKNNSMKNYVTKISSLNNCVISTINVNNSLNSLKKQLYSKAIQVKTMCGLNLDSNIEYTNTKIKTLQELNNNIAANTTRISLTRNEITNNFNNVDNVKAEYSSKTDLLSSRYTKLKNSLNTRLSYYNNLISSLDGLFNLLSNDIDKPITNDYIFEKENSDESLKTSITKNIDTYENAGTNMYGDYRNNPIYNVDNYLKNYNPGYGMYGAYGYGGYGIPNAGMYPNMYGMNGYNYNMPFGNGYLYPNINTFGTYKNIDTYRSRKDLDKRQLIEENIEENKQANDAVDIDLNNQKRNPKQIPHDFNRKKIHPNSIQKKENDEYQENEDQFVDNQDESKLENVKEDVIGNN